LAGYHVGTMGKNYKNYHDLVRLASDHGVEFASIDEFDEMIWLLRYATKENAVSFTAKHLTASFNDARIGGVVARPIRGIPWGFGLSRRKGHILSTAEQRAVDCLVDLAKSLARRGIQGFQADGPDVIS
jgi:hypothetical protein